MAGYLTRLFYLKQDDLWKQEKPYHFKFPNPAGPDTNQIIDRVEDVFVQDLRGQEEVFNISNNGFMIAKLDKELTYEDYHDPGRVEVYFRELERLLQKHTGAVEVRVFRHAVRLVPELFVLSGGVQLPSIAFG